MRKNIILLLFISLYSCSLTKNSLKNDVRKCHKKHYKQCASPVNLVKVYSILEDSLISSNLIKDRTISSYVHFIETIIIPKKKIDYIFLKQLKKSFTRAELANINAPSYVLKTLACLLEILPEKKYKNKTAYNEYYKKIAFLFESGDSNYYSNMIEVIKSTPKNEFETIELRYSVLAAIFNYFFMELDFEKLE